MAEIELRHLRAFAAIDATGSFVAAARVLSMGQPGVSRLIGQLERRLDVQLINRSQPIALTSAGKEFRPFALRALNAVEVAVTPWRERPDILRLGIAWIGGSGAAIRAVKSFERVSPKTRIEIRCLDSQLAGVDEGISDIAIVRGDPNPALFNVRPLGIEAPCIAVSSTHRLSSCDAVCSAELSGEDVVEIDLAVRSAEDRQYSPPGSKVVKVGNTAEWFHSVALDRGIGYTSRFLNDVLDHPEVRFVPIQDADPIQVSIIWPRRGAHPSCQEFSTLAVQAYEEVHNQLS